MCLPVPYTKERDWSDDSEQSVDSDDEYPGPEDSERFKVDWSIDVGNESEDFDRYGGNGFCLIRLGDCIADRFTILHKLGHGGFGTVWLVRDAEERHGRYVALKVVSHLHSENYEVQEVLDRLKKHEGDHGHPGVFLIELERLFHRSSGRRHLCQVFPVLGPPLSSLNLGNTALLYPMFVRYFARQLASGLATMHSLGVCHGDLTMSNLSIRLRKSFDHLTEQQLLADDMFGKPRVRPLDRRFGSPYVVAAADLTRLPVEYYSTKISILDFDQAFLTSNPPRKVAGIPASYLAPESIFALTNSPAADVWALGCILFNLRDPFPLFSDMLGSDPEAKARRMQSALGPLPKEWMSIQFLDGWPVHPELEPDLLDESKPIELLDNPHLFPPLEKCVDHFREPRRLAGGMHPKTGRELFCLHFPCFTVEERAEKERFETENTPLIEKADAKLFSNLLREIFNYDHKSRVTAGQLPEHPWMQETDEELSAFETLLMATDNANVPPRADHDRVRDLGNTAGGSENQSPSSGPCVDEPGPEECCREEKSPGSAWEGGVTEEAACKEDEAAKGEEGGDKRLN
ncbi:kinase-like domain-containing protein [Chaetomium fimeti]|uniref:Kinase-like domain-containing protein n=1 Tax=Chaetomium fimeti TaxID=1854472 RepID=A0AAE0HQH6_9PEZI|nr:kinase-like domain-containing protein [Chaetomium fimeti]